jgi:hypothetical protein
MGQLYVADRDNPARRHADASGSGRLIGRIGIKNL